MSDCIFCSIIAGNIPCTKVYEDDHVLAFNDVNPKARVHVLVVPKTHFDRLHESDESHTETSRTAPSRCGQSSRRHQHQGFRLPRPIQPGPWCRTRGLSPPRPRDRQVNLIGVNCSFKSHDRPANPPDPPHRHRPSRDDARNAACQRLASTAVKSRPSPA